MAMGLIQAQPLLLTQLPTGSLGTYADLLAEDGPRLSLEEVQARQRDGLFRKSSRPVLTFGIGTRPLWVHLEVVNLTAESMPLRMAAGAGWTDRLDVFVVHDNRVSASWQTGDEYPNPYGLTPATGFTFAPRFAPGHSDLYLRAESIDPLVLPVELMTEEQAAANERFVQYGYGLIYGFLLALIAYNSMLFAGLRERSYLYYSLYLASFILLNFSYTGHGSAWLWPELPQLQRYAILVLMVLYSCCGLLFASRFLALSEHAPRVLRLVRLSALSGTGLLALCIVIGSQQGAALVAFSFTTLFTLSMVLLGILTIRHGRTAGRYFLAAALCGMLGAVTTTLAVWGWLPFNALTYHAVEFGVIVEATLLALALAHHFDEMTVKLSKVTVSRDVLSTEVAERKEVEKRLRKSEESLRESQVIAGVGSYTLDIPSGLFEISDVTGQLFGVDDSYERSVKGWEVLIHPDDRAMMADYFGNEILGQGNNFDREYRIVRHNDQAVRWVHGLGKLEFDAQGQPLILRGTVQDITERKHAEQALRESDRHKDEFLAMLAHELRNPLVPIRNAAHIIGKLGLDEPRIEWVRQVIESQVGLLSRMVDDLLDVSRIACGKITLKQEEIDLAALVEQLMQSIRPLAENKGHRLAIRLPDQPAHLRGDPVRLSQVLFNLIDNAIKYTPDGGRIELDVRMAGREVEISVRDNGMGITAALLPRVFDLFQQGERTLERAQGGLGIGLTLVHRLVGMHGGRVAVYSAGAGLGSTFSIWLPVRLMAVHPNALDEQDKSGIAAGTRVLVVDDDHAVADSTAMLLKLEGYEVSVADTGQAALEQVQAFRPQVVLLDIGLTGMDGFETAKRLRELPEGRDVCIVAVTGYGDEKTRAQALASGCDQFLVKPVTFFVLQSTVARIVRNEIGEDVGNFEISRKRK